MRLAVHLGSFNCPCRLGSEDIGPFVAIVFRSIAVALLGAVLGLFMTWLSIERGHGFGAVMAGPWTGWPNAGTQRADPYARAAIARTGQVPLDLAEGLTFIARTDSAGAVLSSSCHYTIRPPVPIARFWSVTVSTPDGKLQDPAAIRNGITSSEIYRRGAGSFAIEVAAGVQPGNWLPVKSGEPFVLVLRLYDSPVSAAARALQASDLPSIEKKECR